MKKCFIDFLKALDSDDQNVTHALLRSYGVDRRLIGLLKTVSRSRQCDAWFSALYKCSYLLIYLLK